MPNKQNRYAYLLLVLSLLITAIVYWPGLNGGFLFDDYPNIVDNKGVQPTDATVPSLVRVALSSPSSEFKRPLASLSFAANYLAAGLNPYGMKLTNLFIHLLNGWLVFLLARALLLVEAGGTPSIDVAGTRRRAGIVAALIAAGWMLLPINLTGVLYIVQRMESMANLFVLLGLIGYVAGRERMLLGTMRGGLPLCVASITLPALVGVLAKETAVMLPLYALLIEWALFRFDRRGAPGMPCEPAAHPARRSRDVRVVTLFVILLVLPLIVGLLWLLPGLLKSGAWASRDFTLGTRLLTELRVVADYIGWTLLPTPDALSFYHDNFTVSRGLLSPWTTLASLLALVALAALTVRLRTRQPIAALGLALFLGCQILTATVLPLELVYEHRNYFASFGLMLTVVPWLAGIATTPKGDAASPDTGWYATKRVFFALPRRTLLGCLFVWWAVTTAITAVAWGNPLSLAQELAARAPDSPRAQYELGRTYIIYSHYDPSSPFTSLAYAPLERAARLPGSSILPQQALVFMNSRMHRPIKDEWWDSMVAKLKARPSGVQDESSLGALTQCALEGACALPKNRMRDAFLAALSHPFPSARLLATYGDYAWNVLDDHALGERLTRQAVEAAPEEPAYRITLIRMLVVQDQIGEARQALAQLKTLNIGGRLNDALAELHTLRGLQ